MTNKTRIRVARIAAGAVITAGASLTVAGTAQAFAVTGTGTVGAAASDAVPQADDPTTPPPGTGEPTEIPDPPTTPPTTGDPTTTPPTTDDPTTTPPTTDDPTTTPPTTDDPTTTPPATDDPTTPPSATTSPTPKPSQTSSAPGGSGTGGSTGGDDQGAGECVVAISGAECADNTDTDSVGNQPVQQGEAKDQLAETGTEQTSFLLVGTATMLAGGLGLRVLSRRIGAGRATG